MKKVKIAAEIRINAWEVVSRAVAEGIVRGWTRAHKYADNPSEAAIKDQIEMSVGEALAEVLDFEGR